MEERSTPPDRPDLRARNRDRNRAEVAAVAVELFADRGFDAVTIDDIAAAAGISRRTFFRYFDSKEDAVVPYEEELLEQFRALLDEHHPDEPLLVRIRRATTAMMAAPGLFDREDTLRRLRLIRDNPSVHARSLQLRSRWEQALRDVIAEHLGVEPATSVTANVAAAAAVSAARASAEVWLATDGRADLAELLEQAYDLLAEGLARAAD